MRMHVASAFAFKCLVSQVCQCLSFTTNATGVSMERKIGTHSEYGCGGDVFYVSSASYGERYCKKCGQSSHNYWNNPATGKRMAPAAPGYNPLDGGAAIESHETVDPERYLDDLAEGV